MRIVLIAHSRLACIFKLLFFLYTYFKHLCVIFSADHIILSVSKLPVKDVCSWSFTAYNPVIFKLICSIFEGSFKFRTNVLMYYSSSLFVLNFIIVVTHKFLLLQKCGASEIFFYLDASWNYLLMSNQSR